MPVRKLAPLILTAVVSVAVLLGVLRMFPDLSNPFHEETLDRTGPSVLQSLTDLSEFHAASAYYETVVDIEEDTKLLPSWVSGQRVLYVGKGTVSGFVDFSELDEDRVVVSDDRTSATIRLPRPTVGKPTLDLENSYVVEHSKGLGDKFGGSELEREAQLKAVKQMATAAADEGTLTDLAKKNTILMLQGLLGALGFIDVTITFDGEPDPTKRPPT